MSYISLFACFVCSILITPFVKKFALAIGAVDKPNERKVHVKMMPRLGGLAIFLSFVLGVIIFQPSDPHHISFIIGGLVIILVGFIDDKYELLPIFKLIGQIIAALIVVLYGGLEINSINLPFDGTLEFGLFSIPITILWIIGVTNAINLIDGLDGLASGVSSIALFSIAVMAFFMGNTYAFIMALILLCSTLGFLVYNFYPAKIFLGDTGALFLGFMISVLSLLGFKNVAIISLIFPVFILGVPLSDTFLAIIRRLINKQSIAKPDKSHLHHGLLKAGFTHRETVIIIYAISMLFSLIAFIFTMTSSWGTLLILSVILLALEILAENLGLISKEYRPILNFLKESKNNKGA